MTDLFLPSGASRAGAVKSGGEEVTVGVRVVTSTGFVIGEWWVIESEEEDEDQSDQKGHSEKKLRRSIEELRAVDSPEIAVVPL